MGLVASLYHLPPRVLPSIQAVEGGRSGLAHRNLNDTEDLGVMQVNTIWLRPLARYTHTDPATVYLRLRDDTCYNVAAAGAIMRRYLDETHGDVLLAVGNYHSHTPELNLAYQGMVVRQARILFMPGTAPAARLVMQRTVAQRLALQRRLTREARAGSQRARS